MAAVAPSPAGSYCLLSRVQTYIASGENARDSCLHLFVGDDLSRLVGDSSPLMKSVFGLKPMEIKTPAVSSDDVSLAVHVVELQVRDGIRADNHVDRRVPPHIYLGSVVTFSWRLRVMRSWSRRWIMVTLEANLARCRASVIAVLSPPTMATGLSLKKGASQVAQ